MIYREYETRFDDYEKKTEYRISISTDSFDLYANLKDTTERMIDKYEMAREWGEEEATP